MLDDLDTSLRRLLDDLAAPAVLRAADVSFATPERGYAPAPQTVNLFVHELRENRTLRDPAPLRDPIPGMVRERRPPLRVDCTYMVTAWSSTTNAGTRTAEQHRLLSLALLWLSRHPEIPPVHCAGSLATAVYHPPTMVAQAEGPATGVDFWTALGIAPRPSFRLLVTIELELADVSPVGPPVVTKELRFLDRADGQALEEGFQIAGRVTAQTGGAPVVGALVTVLETGQTAVTDERGRFSILGLTAGGYTLRTVRAGFTDRDTTVSVPGTALDDYDHTLS